MNGADMLQRQSDDVILCFSAARRRTVTHRFRIGDRITALSWAKSAEQLGLTKLVFEAAADMGDCDAGEFILIYARDAAWSSWGIGCNASGMMLWHAARGTTIGQFPNLGAALARIGTIIAQPA